MCLFNHQIKFMASFFSTTRLPLHFQEEEYDPSIISVGARSALALSPSPRRTPRAPAAISFSLRANPSGLVSFPPPLLLFSPLLSSRPPLFKASAQALSQVLEGRNLAWFFRPVCWLCCGNCLLRGTRLCSAPLSSPPDVNTQPRLLLAPLKRLVKITTGPVLVVIITTDTC